MQTYSQFRPSSCDPAGLGLSDRQDWLVVPVFQNRDSEALARSNFEVVLKELTSLESEEGDVEKHNFGHWANGWFEIILVRPDSPAAKSAQEWEDYFADNVIASEEHFSNLEHEDAQQTWENCYTNASRIEYIREHRNDFEFHSLADLMGCVKGKHYNGSASELLG